MPHSTAHDAGPAASAEAFVAVLRDEQAALAAFAGLLHAEQDALVQGDAGRVAELAAEKADSIELLTHLGEQRKRHLAAQDLNDNAEGMLAWLKRNSGFGAAAGKIWRELLTQAEAARRINETNGLLIQSKLHQNRLKLAVLQTAAASGGVYCSDGQLGPLRGTRSLSHV